MCRIFRVILVEAVLFILSDCEVKFFAHLDRRGFSQLNDLRTLHLSLVFWETDGLFALSEGLFVLSIIHVCPGIL